MSSRILQIGVVLLACGTFPPGASANPPEQVLLLRNSQTVVGQIIEHPDHYLVVLPHGEIRIQHDRVDTICGSLQEAYLTLRKRKITGRVADYVAMAHWCLRHQLLDEARRELAEAAVRNPSHPLVKQLEYRIAQVSNPNPNGSQLAAGQGTKSPQSLPSRARSPFSLPDGLIREFTRTIQPILLKHCGTGGCHGGTAGGKFRLARTSPGRSPSRKVTFQNLSAVMEWIGEDEESDQQLLAAATVGHGGATEAPLQHRPSALHSLKAWIALVQSKPEIDDPDSVATDDFALGQSLDRISPATPARRELLRSHRLRSREGNAPPAARDPFDAEVFNRQHGAAQRKMP